MLFHALGFTSRFDLARVSHFFADARIEEVPSRSSSSLIIHHRLGSESHYQAVAGHDPKAMCIAASRTLSPGGSRGRATRIM